GLRAGQALRRKGVSRGAAVGDFNNNGELSLVVTQLEGPPLLLRKLAADRLARARQHWLTVKTVGKRSNRNGFGARVEIRAGGLSQTQEVRANSSYLSASDPRVHFGVGAATKIES